MLALRLLVPLFIVVFATPVCSADHTYKKGESVEVRITDNSGKDTWMAGKVENIVTWKDADGKTGTVYTITIPIPDQKVQITEADAGTILRQPQKK